MQPYQDETLDDGPDAQAAEEAERKAADERSAMVRALGIRLQAEFAKRKSSRTQVEQRWLRDIRQYNGEYEPEIKSRLEERKFGSRAYVPLTRRISNLVEARLGDLLFPSDDRNFVVSASPVPEMADAEKLAKQLPAEAPVDAGGNPIPANAVGLALREMREEAERKATGMQRAVDDQLQEARYATESRKAIHDAIKLGTGVLKGPIVAGRMRKQWTVADGQAAFAQVEDLSPTVVRVDPWAFYPDLSENDLRPDSDVYELHRLTKLGLAKLVKQPGFDAEAIARVIDEGARNSNDANEDAQRVSAGTVGVIDTARWNLVEFTGTVDAEELEAYGLNLEPEREDGEDTAVDKLAMYSACVWFSEWTGEVVKAILYPMDTNEQPYSVFCWQPDTACIFGFGLPYELRDLQEGANSTYRAAMDNMGLSVGPQGVVNSAKIRPMNGNWQIEPNKLWDVTDPSMPVGNAMAFIGIDSRVDELLGLFNTIKSLADEIGGPMLAMQGQDAPKLAQAGATGMSIAYNAASVWMRRAVKLWDDGITTPLLTRFVDWNMQYNDDPNIKGDLNVIARGTSALLQAEGQVARLQTLMQLAQQAGVPIRKVVNILRSMALSMRLDPDDLLPSDEEVAQMEAERAQQGPPPNPELERIEIRKAELQNNEAERAFRLSLQRENNEMRMMELAERNNLTAEQARARFSLDAEKMTAEMTNAREQRVHDAQKFNTEVAVKTTQGSGI